MEPVVLFLAAGYLACVTGLFGLAWRKILRPKTYASLAEAEEHGLGGVLDFAAQQVAPTLADPDAFLLEAMREVDALYPDTQAIAPPPPPPAVDWRKPHAYEGTKGNGYCDHCQRWQYADVHQMYLNLSKLIAPDAGVAEVSGD